MRFLQIRGGGFGESLGKYVCMGGCLRWGLGAGGGGRNRRGGITIRGGWAAGGVWGGYDGEDGEEEEGEGEYCYI